MGDTIGSKNSQPIRKKKRKSNLDASSKRKIKYNKQTKIAPFASNSTTSTLTDVTYALDCSISAFTYAPSCSSSSDTEIDEKLPEKIDYA